MTKIRFIGDIHGKVEDYAKIAFGSDYSVQVGDFGFGFNIDEDRASEVHKSGKRKFIRGNHDDPKRAKAHTGYIKDGTYDPYTDIMYIGGAWSIDYQWRVPGLSWWPDEEISYQDFIIIEDDYYRQKPSIMVTHDCPSSVAWELFLKPNKRQFSTRTGEFLEKMYRGHKPKLWIFGHWHESVDKILDGTRFICLNELSYEDIETEDYT